MRVNEVHEYEERQSRAEARPGLRASMGLSPRRLAVLVAGFLCLYMVGVFARQVGEAASAAAEADTMRARNVAIQQDLDSLRAELELIQQPGFVGSAARGYGLGSPGEVTVTLDPHAPPLPPGSPGSTGIRPEPGTVTQSPLEAWLQALFGSD